jgi:hypothetical protein
MGGSTGRAHDHRAFSRACHLTIRRGRKPLSIICEGEGPVDSPLLGEHYGQCDRAGSDVACGEECPARLMSSVDVILPMPSR